MRYKNSLGMEFVLVAKGTFWMGGKGGVPGQKSVEISEDFDMGVTEVTQAQWQALMGYNPSFFSRQGGGKPAVRNIPDVDLKEFPVESVSWLGTQEFLKKLNDRERTRGKLYRLPTDAEWEYACRGGPTMSQEDCATTFTCPIRATTCRRSKRISKETNRAATRLRGHFGVVRVRCEATDRIGWAFMTCTAM